MDIKTRFVLNTESFCGYKLICACCLFKAPSLIYSYTWHIHFMPEHRPRSYAPQYTAPINMVLYFSILNIKKDMGIYIPIYVIFCIIVMLIPKF